MLLKTALRNLRKNPVMNIICLVQLIAVFMITAVMVSAMSIRYRTYEPVRDILESNGLYCVYNQICGAVKPGGATVDIRDSIFSADELREYMQADKAMTIRIVTAFPNGFSFRTDENTTYKAARQLFYDDEILKRYKPELKRGRWISKDSDELEIVIPEGTYGADIGDTIDFLIVQVDDPVQVSMRVVGILKDGTEILGRERPRNETGDIYRLMYEPYYINIEGDRNPVMLASSSALERLYPGTQAQMETAFFIYNNGSDTEQWLKNAAQLSPSMVISLSDMNANSLAYLREQLLQLLPIVVVLMILVIVSAVSVSAISARQRLNDYAKFYILGLRWKQCAMVNFLQALTTGAAALVITALVLLVAGLTPISQSIMIIWNPWLMLSLIGILALYLVFSMIMPLLMIGVTTPKSLLQSESGG